jgi:hypothetical protein
MPAYYAMGYLSEGLYNVPTIGEHPPAKTPNAAPQPRPEAGMDGALPQRNASSHTVSETYVQPLTLVER